jgi:pimeloyl-ACP methyl ester carboxylesterase
MFKTAMWSLFVVSISLIAVADEEAGVEVTKGKVKSADGLKIAYVTAGEGEDALLFIHGGFADSSFWSNQLESLSDRYLVVAMDMAGHGQSGRKRKTWSLASFGEDVRAVVDALELKRVVLIGNSMGGPVALEAARIMPERVIAVIGIDTLHDATAARNDEQMEAYIQMWRDDYKGTCALMVKALLHTDADPVLLEDARHRMCDTEPQVPVDVMGCFIGYELSDAMEAVDVPVRSLNGDIYPTNVAGNKQYADYGAVVMKHMGHYPMLEDPAEFDRLLTEMLVRLGMPGS